MLLIRRIHVRIMTPVTVAVTVYAALNSSIQEMIVNDVHCYLPFSFVTEPFFKLWRGESLWKQTPWRVRGVQP